MSRKGKTAPMVAAAAGNGDGRARTGQVERRRAGVKSLVFRHGPPLLALAPAPARPGGRRARARPRQALVTTSNASFHSPRTTAAASYTTTTVCPSSPPPRLPISHPRLPTPPPRHPFPPLPLLDFSAPPPPPCRPGCSRVSGPEARALRSSSSYYLVGISAQNSGPPVTDARCAGESAVGKVRFHPRQPAAR